MEMILTATYSIVLFVYVAVIVWCLFGPGFTRERVLTLLGLTIVHGTLALWLDLVPGIVFAGVSLGVWAFMLLEPVAEEIA